MDRRLFIVALLSLGLAPALAPDFARAKDGGDDGDSGGGDSGGSGSDDSDDDSGGDDSDDDDNNSGRGRGGNDDRDDDDDDDNDDKSGKSGRDRDHQKAREAVDEGRILPLREILKRVDDLGGGRVIAVDLNLRARAPYYTLKVQSGSRVRTLKLEAATGRKLNLFGW